MGKEPGTSKETIRVEIEVEGLEQGAETYENKQAVVVRLFSSAPKVQLLLRDFYNANFEIASSYTNTGDSTISYGPVHFGKGPHALMIQGKSITGECSQEVFMFKILSGDMGDEVISKIHKDSVLSEMETSFALEPITSFRFHVPTIPNHSGGYDKMTVWGRESKAHEYVPICSANVVSGAYMEADEDGNLYFGTLPETKEIGWSDPYNVPFDRTRWRQLKGTYELAGEHHLRCLEYAHDAMRLEVYRTAGSSKAIDEYSFYMSQFGDGTW